MKKILIFILLGCPFLINGQNILLKKAVSDSNFPKIIWFTTQHVDTTDFKVFRASLKNKIFKEIETISYAKPSEISDTTEFIVVDTSLTKKGIYLYYTEAQINGKTAKSQTAIGHNYGLLPKPQIVQFKATPLKDRKAVKLTWKLNYAQTVSSLELFRSKTFNDGYIKITDIPADANEITDVIPKANEAWFYFIKINDFFGGQFVSVRIPAFATFSEKPFRPQNISGKFSGDSVYLNWKNTGKNSTGYRIYRSTNGKAFILINEMIQNSAENIKFTDFSAETEKAVNLAYYAVNVSDGFKDSNSSDTVNLYIPEHEPVLPPETVDCISNESGDIKLFWVPPEKGKTFAYNVYLKNPSGKKFKLNKNKLSQNYFIDTISRPEGKYIYEIESIGFGNKVSAGRARAVTYRYKPRIHLIVNLIKRNSGIEISWKKSLNKHIKKIKLYKKSSNGKTALLKTFSNNDTIYLDKNLNRGTAYIYIIKAVSDNNKEIILNEGSEIIW